MQRRLDFGTPRTRHPNRHLGSGSGSNPLNGATLTVSLSSASPFINNNVTVTATLLDKNGNPLEGYDVTIAISGVNTATSTSATNASGQTTYTYQSTTAGADVALASIEDLSDSENITWAIDFLLNDKFTDTDPAPITLPRTATPTGTLTGSDASNLLSVGSGVLNVADNASATIRLYDAQRARAAGLAGMISVNPLTNNANLLLFWGWNNANNAAPSQLGFTRTLGAGIVRMLIGGNVSAWNLPGSLTANAFSTFAIVLFSNRNEYYQLIAESWVLVWVDYSVTDANMFWGMGRTTVQIYAHTQDNYRVAVLGAASTNLFAQLVGNISAGATSAARNGNMLIAFDLDTLTSSANMIVKFRIQDANNYWRLRITSSGGFALDEIVAGGSTSRGTSTPPLVGGEKIRVIADGTTISGYYNNTQAWSYASASNFQNETAIEVSSLGTGGAISDMDIYDRYAVGIPDANLDALAAG